ncbi:MAG: hypothetical protein COZ65_02665 [Caldiserica bacterium CG_4_8_14_3_um_filter_35_18]|nr:MAG: hypothetical protein COZ65_02665 [Caldiserica bacterium CG_4_8_14_3_um_filter_35_18]
MKRLLTVISIIAILITIFGCNRSNFKVSITDSKTGFPIEGKIQVNGKSVKINEGILYLNEGDYTIEKEGYGNLNLGINGNRTNNISTYMEPISYLIILTDNQNTKILIDEAERKGKIEEESIIISPVNEGQHSIVIEAPFYITKKITEEFHKGENLINANLALDSEKVQELLKNIEFPEDNKNFNFSITITGDISKNKFSYDLEGAVKNNLIENISDNNVSYTFKNSEPFINNEQVDDLERATILKFARDTIQEFLQFKEKIKSLNLKDANTDSISFTGEREFEDRKFSETIKLTLYENKVSSVTVNISSQDLQVDLEATISITIN